MIYLDYSATTPVNKEVLTTFKRVCLDYPGNPHAAHELGLKAKELMAETTHQILKLLELEARTVIYTSGATAANNLALKGVASFYQNRGQHLITTKLEHASVREPLKYLEKKGYVVSYVNLLPSGEVDLNHLESLITPSTILVSIPAVDSELGIKQPIGAIAKMLKVYPLVKFHVDGSQAVGKIPLSLTGVDLFTFSSHKIYGIPGFGVLVKSSNCNLSPLLHGGKEQVKGYAGTPSLPLIVAGAKALRLSLEDLQLKAAAVLKLKQRLQAELSGYPDIIINSPKQSIPQILNISLKNIKAETFVRALSERKVYLSSKSACADPGALSLPVLALTNDKKRASSSLRISLSFLTTREEVEKFLTIFGEIYKVLNIRKRGN